MWNRVDEGTSKGNVPVVPNVNIQRLRQSQQQQYNVGDNTNRNSQTPQNGTVSNGRSSRPTNVNRAKVHPKVSNHGMRGRAKILG